MMEEPRDYRIKFAVIKAEDIDDLVVIGNDHFGTVKVPAGATIYGTRPVVPPNDRVAYMTQRNDFYLRLEESMLDEGIRNPIFCVATSKGIYGAYGTTRLWIAKKHNLPLPCIVADYNDALPDAEELFTKGEITDKFKDPPGHLLLLKEKMDMWGCQHTHLADFVIKGEMKDKASQKEKAKYEKMWQEKSYRGASPALSYLEHFIRVANPGKSIVDFGCGTGQASLEFKKRGFDVTLVDLASNCLNPVVQNELSENFRFVECSLWDIPEEVEADYGYCCDVMEHLPEDKVAATLKGIYKATVGSTFFSISTINDSCGKLIGDTLHLTVKPAEWWVDRIEEVGWTVKSLNKQACNFSLLAVKEQ